MTTNAVLLDTHVWFRYQNNSNLLSERAVQAIDSAGQLGRIFVSPISVWELALLEKGGKLTFDDGVQAWVKEALNLPGIKLLPYSPAIAIESVYLPQPMHKDPSDRILVASARVENMTLITSDKAILAFAKTTGLAHLRA